MAGPCDNCGKAGARSVCSGCSRISIYRYYCDRNCQKAAWKLHKPHCGKPEPGPNRTTVRADRSASFRRQTADVLSGRTVEEGGSPGIHLIVNDRPWWEGLTPERQRERLLMSFQLLCEDARVWRQERIGVYNETVEPHHDFVRYALTADGKGLLPEGCRGEFIGSDYARNMARRKTTKPEIVKRFGYSSAEHVVLRWMAESITGVPTQGPGFSTAERTAKAITNNGQNLEWFGMSNLQQTNLYRSIFGDPRT